MLKYPVKGKIITVHGEEEYMISHLNSFRYVEVEGEFIETPFQHFEEVLPEIAVAKLAVEAPRQMARMASLEDAKAAIKEVPQVGTNPHPESYDALPLHSPCDQRSCYGRRGSIHPPTS